MDPSEYWNQLEETSYLGVDNVAAGSATDDIMNFDPTMPDVFENLDFLADEFVQNPLITPREQSAVQGVDHAESNARIEGTVTGSSALTGATAVTHLNPGHSSARDACIFSPHPPSTDFHIICVFCQTPISKVNEGKDVSSTGIKVGSPSDVDKNTTSERGYGMQKSEPVKDYVRQYNFFGKSEFFLRQADDAFRAAIHDERSRQQKILLCYVQALPDNTRKSRDLCMEMAMRAYTKLILSKIDHFCTAHPHIKFDFLDGIPRLADRLHVTLVTIVSLQNRYRRLNSMLEVRTHGLAVGMEARRWELELMLGLSRFLDNKRLRVIEETRNRYVIADGIYMDLLTMVSWPIGDEPI